MPADQLRVVRQAQPQYCMARPEFPDPLKPERNGSAFQYAHPHGGEPERGYYTGVTNEEKLINALLERLRETESKDQVLKDFYYKDYKSHRSSTKKDRIWQKVGPGEYDYRTYTSTTYFDIPIKVDHESLNSTATKMSKKMGADIDVNPKYRVDIDLDNTKTKYYTLFNFVDDTKYVEGDITSKTNTLNENFDVTGTSGKHILAVEFKTIEVEEFLLLNVKLDDHFSNLKDYIIDKFEDVRLTLNTEAVKLSDATRLKIYNFFSQAPMFYLATLTPEELWNGLYHIFLYDISTLFFDYSDGMVRMLSAMIGVDGGTSYLYQVFNSTPYFAKRIYHHMDGSEVSVTHNGHKVARKTIFATLMWFIADDQNQWKDYPERDKRHIRFEITSGKQVDSNILWNDKYEGKYNLTQETYIRKTQTVHGKYSTINIDKSYWKAGTTRYLHPLDMVTLVTTGPKGRYQELVVPAIFVKDLAYHREWEEVFAIIRVVINILIVVISLVTLAFGNPGPLMVAISVIDLGLATADIAIQAFADEIRKLEGGQEFLDGWETFYFAAGIVTGLPLLGSLLKGGAKLLLKTLTAESKAQLLVMVKHAMRSIKNFPKFAKGEFDLIRFYALELGYVLARRMQLLANEGVLLFKGKLEGTLVERYYLSYKDVILKSGKLEQIKSEINFIVSRGENNLLNYIDNVLRPKALRYVYTGGKRGEEILTLTQKQEILEYATQYGIDKSAISFGDNINTGYKRFFGIQDRLQIGTDVMPGVGANALSANSRLSWKSAIAHELEGHRAAELAGKTQSSALYEEVQASMRASIHGKGLTEAERALLKEDAIERLAKYEPNTKLDDIVDFLWLEKY